MSQVYLTPGGRRRLAARVEATRAAYLRVCADNPEALESGDTSGWHDNFAFEENQRQMHQLARQVRELETLLAAARIVPLHRVTPDRVFLGARVAWRFVDEDDLREGWIAGWDDGDPASGRISYNSPLGRVLVGAEPGEVREVTLGGLRREVEVLEVGPASEAEDDR